MLSESKLDETFLLVSFLIDGFHPPFKFDRDKNGGEIMLYVREDIPARILSHNSSVIRQKCESQSWCFKKTKHAKFSEKRTFLTP